MITKYLIGSQFLKLQNCKDTDYLLTGEQLSTVSLQKNESYLPIDFFQWYVDFLKGDEEKTTDSFVFFTLYQFSQGWRPDFPVKFEMLDFKKKWIKLLQHFVNSEEATKRMLTGGKATKVFYHIAYQYYILKENTYQISEEGLSLVQHIHDFGMEEKDFFELKNMVNSLEV